MTNHRIWSATALLAALLMVSNMASAQVYKWVDANGRVHFGDAAPADQKSETLKLPEVDPSRSAGADTSEQERMERQRRLSQALEEERLEKERLKAEAKAKEEKQAAYCERFRNRLERLQASSRVYSENKDGTVRYWKEADAERFRVEKREQYEKECGSLGQ